MIQCLFVRTSDTLILRFWLKISKNFPKKMFIFEETLKRTRKKCWWIFRCYNDGPSMAVI